MKDIRTVAPGSECVQCQHPFDDHLLYTRNPLDGGWIECPVDGCTCLSTWDVAIEGGPT